MQKMNSSKKINIIEYRDGSFSETLGSIASEERLSIFSNDKEILSLLCTPTMVRELVVGFGISEGLLTDKNYSDIQQTWCSERIEILWKDEGIEVRLPVDVPENVATMTSGCAKGVTFMSNSDEEIPLILDDFKVSINAIFELYRKFHKKSELFRTTGGVHSAALCNEKEIIVLLKI